MPAQQGYFDTLKSAAGKIFAYLASITLTGTDGKTITCTQDTSLDEAVAMSSKATQTAGADYFATSTIVGWAATPTGYIRYSRIGKIVFVAFYIQGTSNSVTTTFTLPVAAVNPGTVYWSTALMITHDNGSYLSTAGRAYIANNSSTVTVDRDVTAAAWTASGGKIVAGSLWYEGV